MKTPKVLLDALLEGMIAAGVLPEGTSIK